MSASRDAPPSRFADASVALVLPTEESTEEDGISPRLCPVEGGTEKKMTPSKMQCGGSLEMGQGLGARECGNQRTHTKASQTVFNQDCRLALECNMPP